MGSIMFRWVVFMILCLVSPKRLHLNFYSNGPVAGYIGWVDVRGLGTIAFIAPGGQYHFRW